MRILIAEDSATCRMILSAALKEYGYEVIETKDGQQAWEKMRQPDAPQLAILDWIMPKMDGLSLLGKIRAQKTERPPYIIMLTGKDDKDDIILGLDAGANDYLSKTFDKRELRARVEVGRRMIELQDALIVTNEKLAFQAAHDALTGILNRRAILYRLEDEFINKKNNNPITIGMCDIDHFKKINDTYGHQTGDEVLCGLVKVFKECFSASDYFGRIGGEEFLIVASSSTKKEALTMFEKCCRHIADTKINTRSGGLSITISIGVASCTSKSSVDALLGAADSALYQAKNQGRNRVCYKNI
ncbi:MAG: diguanylate cyclase [Christensenellales bacterium]